MKRCIVFMNSLGCGTGLCSTALGYRMPDVPFPDVAAHLHESTIAIISLSSSGVFFGGDIHLFMIFLYTKNTNIQLVFDQIYPEGMNCACPVIKYCCIYKT